MRIMKTLAMSTLVLVTSLSCFGKDLDSDKTDWTFTSPAHGGVATGGGSTLGSGKVSPEEIANLVKKAKVPALYAFRHLDLLYRMLTVSSDTAETYQTRVLPVLVKLFAGDKNIYQALRDAELDPKDHCYNSEGVEKEASVVASPSLCFNLTMLADRLTQDTAEIEIVALVMHEVSHMVKTTEPEGHTLQFMVKSSLMRNPYTKIPELVKQFNVGLTDSKSSTSVLLSQFSKLQDQEVCSFISILGSNIRVLPEQNIKAFSQEGIVFLPPKDIGKLIGLFYKSINMNTFCGLSIGNYKKIDDFYGSSRELSVEEFGRKMYPNNPKNSALPNWKIRKIAPNDRVTLQLELREIVQELNTIN